MLMRLRSGIFDDVCWSRCSVQARLPRCFQVDHTPET